MTVWLTMRYDHDEGSDPIGIYEKREYGQYAAELNAKELGVWEQDTDVETEAWWFITTHGLEYSVMAYEVEGGPWTPQSSGGTKPT